MGTTDNRPYTKNGNSLTQRMPSISEESKLKSLRKQKPPNVSPNVGWGVECARAKLGGAERREKTLLNMRMNIRSTCA